ncbi:MAG: PDZ domain-containing protein, partial [Nitrospinota bacterium]|nr:PDZ domain-containing protein [Nitrospinota bacterium]
KGTIVRGFLGVSIQPVDETLAKALKLDKAQGALVSSLVKDGPAAKAGVKRGDVILSLNGVNVKDPRTLSRMAAGLSPGDKGKLGISRKGKSLTISLTIGKMPGQTRVARATGKAELGDKLGLEGQNLTPDIAKQIGAESKAGVVIVRVMPQSPAANAGLRRGDVIIEANQKTVITVDDLSAAIRRNKKEDNLFLIERRGATRFVVIEGTG